MAPVLPNTSAATTSVINPENGKVTTVYHAWTFIPHSGAYISAFNCFCVTVYSGMSQTGFVFITNFSSFLYLIETGLSLRTTEACILAGVCVCERGKSGRLVSLTIVFADCGSLVSFYFFLLVHWNILKLDTLFLLFAQQLPWSLYCPSTLAKSDSRHKLTSTSVHLYTVNCWGWDHSFSWTPYINVQCIYFLWCPTICMRWNGQ